MPLRHRKSGCLAPLTDDSDLSSDKNRVPTLGNYELLTRLATGGMAEIFLARQSGIGGLERLVVIKRIKREYAQDPNFTEMFLREARIVARINDPNVVQIFELGEEEGDYFISMEYIHGLTIAEMIKAATEANTWFTLEAAIAVTEQACKGLHQVHEVKDLDGNRMGLIHRDVSHQNFICSEDGNVKLIDFGIAKSTESKEEATYSGSVKGKYAYMSPEQCSRKELDRRSDIFSLGVVAWELLGGKRLFKRQDKLETVQAITKGEISPPGSNNPGVPEAVDRVVMRALERDPDDRYQTADAFRAALLDAARSQGLDIGADQLGVFLERVGRDRLEEKRRKFRAAVDEHAGTGDENLDWGDLRAPGKGSGTWTKRVGETMPVVLILAAVAALGVTLWFVFGKDGGGSHASAAGTQPNGPPITVGWPPIVDPTVIEEETAPVWEHLETKLGRPVELRYTTTYERLSEQIRSGKLDFAMMPPLLYVQTKFAEPQLEPLAVREFDGSTSIDGIILVPADSDLSTLEDLKGERVCFTDRHSTTGNFLPRAHLRRHGYDPDEFLGPAQWSGSHVRVLRDLSAGRCAAAATSSASLLTGGEFGVSVGKFRTLAVTGHVPQDVFAAGPEASEELTEKIEKVLLMLNPRDVVGKPRISDKMKITGFAEIDDSAYEDLREAVEAADTSKDTQ